MPNAREVGVIHMPLESIPPGEGLHTTSNHQSTPEHIRSSPEALLVRHGPPDVLSIQLIPIHSDSTACPLFRIPPTTVSYDMALKVRSALVLLNMATSRDRALGVGFLVDEGGNVFALEIARGDVAPVRAGTSCIARRSSALLGSRGSGTRGR